MDPTTNGESLWPRLAELPLVVEGCEYDSLRAVLTQEFERVTTPRAARRRARTAWARTSRRPRRAPRVHETGRSCRSPASGRSARSASAWRALDQWPEPPEWHAARNYRNWAFESAALDLALRQAGRPLHDVLGREPHPVRFVNSLGLGDDPSTETHPPAARRPPERRLQARRGAGLEPGAPGRAGGHGRGPAGRLQGPLRLRGRPTRRRSSRCTSAWSPPSPTPILEDPHDLPAVAELLQPHAAAWSYDAPIHRPAGHRPTPISRTHRQRQALADRLACARCSSSTRTASSTACAMYGGGMGELGVGRGQIELLASLFHPDEPNDVAPSAFNAVEPAPDLPQSPLRAAAGGDGFPLGGLGTEERVRRAVGDRDARPPGRRDDEVGVGLVALIRERGPRRARCTRQAPAGARRPRRARRRP